MTDAKKFVERWLKNNLTDENLASVFPRPENIFDALYLEAEEAGLSRDDLWRKVPDLEKLVLAAATSGRKG